MKTGHSLIAAAMLTAVASASAQVFPDSNVMVAQGTTQDQKAQQELKGAEKIGQRDDTQPMTAAQQAQYKAEYQAAKAKWASLTPEQKSAAVAAARTKKLKDLSYMELVGQRDDMQRETAAQSGQLKAQADAAKASWDKLTPAQKQAARKSAWQKKRAELSGIEAVGQRDDDYVLPW